jgi:hypothetical protein
MKDNTYEVVIKNGKPFLRMWHSIYQNGYYDSMIYKAKSEKPYIKYLGSTWYIEDDKKEMIKKAIA